MEVRRLTRTSVCTSDLVSQVEFACDNAVRVMTEDAIRPLALLKIAVVCTLPVSVTVAV